MKWRVVAGMWLQACCDEPCGCRRDVMTHVVAGVF